MLPNANHMLPCVCFGMVILFAVYMTCSVNAQEVGITELKSVQANQTIPIEEEKPLIISGLGDSILYGDRLEDTFDSFLYLMGKEIGKPVIYNYGLCGSALSGKNADRLLDRYQNMNPDSDYIVVFGGTNDYGYGVPLGKMEDRTDETFYGGLHLLVQGLMDGYPNSRICLLTPIRRLQDTKANSLGFQLQDYADAIMKVADYYGVIALNLLEEEELDFTKSLRTYMPDGLHPNEKGHQKMAEYLIQEFRNIIKTREQYQQ